MCTHVGEKSGRPILRKNVALPALNMLLCLVYSVLHVCLLSDSHECCCGMGEKRGWSGEQKTDSRPWHGMLLPTGMAKAPQT